MSRTFYFCTFKNHETNWKKLKHVQWCQGNKVMMFKDVRCLIQQWKVERNTHVYFDLMPCKVAIVSLENLDDLFIYDNWFVQAMLASFIVKLRLP